MNKASSISKSIKEGKWLNIYYQRDDEITNFWGAIKNININNKVLTISMFNDKKNLNVIKNAYISFEKIISAEVIEFSNYDVPENLIKFIENNISKLEWLEYDKYNNNVLNYYIECNNLDHDPYQKESFLIKGIDIHQLRKQKCYNLNDEQIRTIIDKIYRFDINKTENKKRDLAIIQSSILINNKKYIICYYNLFFDPEKKWLKLDDELIFNKSFLVEGRRYSLFNYISMDIDEFIKNFRQDYFNKIQIIKKHLKKGEIFDDTPEIFLLERQVTVDLFSTFESIETNYCNNLLQTPLKSFFGNMSKKNYYRKKEPNIVVYDQLNINQMAVLYNALKYPVTYVQGPPGTGKTQTILSVILSAFLEEKTVLICSQNNKPVDSIMEKLNFKYQNKEIVFPFLRIGNNEEISLTTKKIREIYELKNGEIYKNLSNDIFELNNDQNKKLLELLATQDKKNQLEDYLISATRILEEIDNENCIIVNNIKQRISQIKQEIKCIPEVNNNELKDLYIPLKDNIEMQKKLYYKSIACINKLHSPKYKKIIDICYIEDDNSRAFEFNKWCSNNKNFKLLNNAFPIILSTNISSNKLGSSNYKFNLVIMDEAGQCNVAHALIPISRAENLLLVGDPNQLKPIVLLEDKVNDRLMKMFNVPESYNYKKYSILEVMLNNDHISKYILLKYHYRCGKKIVNFSNERYYDSALDLSYVKNEGEFEYLDIKNINSFNKNEALEEANEIIRYIKNNNVRDAFILTPFVNQQNLINKLLKENNINDIECGTIHSLQGMEKDTIFFSTALSYKTSKATYSWLKNNFEILNVAVTRAKKKMIISSDTEIIEKLSDKTDDLYHLVNYAKSNGSIIIPPNDTIKLEIGKSNGSKNEDMFYKTISQFCSTQKNFDVKRNVPFYEIFKDDLVLKNSKKEFDVVLYENKFPFTKKPKIVIEINGGEHFGIRKKEISDIRKMNICKQRNIKYIVIDNSFVKSYEEIRNIIIGSKNKKTIKVSLDDVLF